LRKGAVQAAREGGGGHGEPQRGLDQGVHGVVSGGWRMATMVFTTIRFIICQIGTS
jgi:hypothetical protein